MIYIKYRKDMNIFVLDENTAVCASYHVDKHIVKMPTEQSQMISFVYHNEKNWDSEIPDLLMSFNKCHNNHPCSLWIRESLENFMWSCELGVHLVEEYRFRYKTNKHQRAESIFRWALNNPPNFDMWSKTDYALAMPDELKLDNAVDSYRNYYRMAKTELHEWKNRKKPNWI